jgi:hypothetical protein
VLQPGNRKVAKADIPTALHAICYDNDLAVPYFIDDRYYG